MCERIIESRQFLCFLEILSIFVGTCMTCAQIFVQLTENNANFMDDHKTCYLFT